LGGGADKLIISSHVLLETERKRKKQESDIDATRDEGERKGKLNQNSVRVVPVGETTPSFRPRVGQMLFKGLLILFVRGSYRRNQLDLSPSLCLLPILLPCQDFRQSAC
jgi:hypothetical protein